MASLDPLTSRLPAVRPMMTTSSSDVTPDFPDSIAKGDEPAFERVFSAYANPLYRYVYTYVKSKEIAQDIVHEIFFQLWMRVEGEEQIRSLKAYLYTAARYEALNHLKHQKVEERHQKQYRQPTLTLHGPCMPPNADQELAARERAAVLQRAIDELPRRQREVIHLRWNCQFSHAEIAAALGIAVKTVDEHLRRATEHLRQTLPRSLNEPE